MRPEQAGIQPRRLLRREVQASESQGRIVAMKGVVVGADLFLRVADQPELGLCAGAFQRVEALT